MAAASAGASFDAESVLVLLDGIIPQVAASREVDPAAYAALPVVVERALAPRQPR